MKIFKCPQCKRVFKKADDIIYARCACGTPMEYVNEKHEPMQKVKDYKEEYCQYCESKHSCSDIDGDLIDEQVEFCMDANKRLVGEI